MTHVRSLVVVIAALAPPLFGAGAERASAQRYVDPSGVGHTLGDSAAPVEVVEFGDFACSACGQFWRTTWPRVRVELIETGRVRWRHVPFLLGFARGEDGADAAECAAEQGAFWTMHDSLFAGQEEWLKGRRHREVLVRYAVGMGLDAARFSSCFEDHEARDRTKAATRVAKKARVRGTPTFFIGGEPAVGALPFETFLELVRAAEQRRREAP